MWLHEKLQLGHTILERDALSVIAVIEVLVEAVGEVSSERDVECDEECDADDEAVKCEMERDNS